MNKKLNCILLVDDNDSDNFIHKRVIEKAGIANCIEIALNGKEALEFLVTKGKCGKPDSSYSQPDLIFLDINMPVMNGWEFLEAYQKLDDIQKGKVVIVMLTTSLNPNDMAMAEKNLGSGCFQYKPLTPEALSGIMQKHFPEYR